MDKKNIFMLTSVLLLIATSLKAEPLPHLPTEFECKNYESEGYVF